MTLAHATGPPDLVKYRLLDEIGHGGMATVYRALDVRLGRDVAVKLVHPHLRENTEAAARFITEAHAVAKLRHPGIVEIYDVSDEQDVERYLVTELIRGPSLRKLLREHGAMPPEIAACIGVPLCDALAHAHDASVIHRDVKPENVLIELDETAKLAAVKLTDFGIAKLIDAQGVTSTGQVLGSPAHMSPEQIEGGPIDVRADIFGVGVLLYECMVGHLPFDGKNPAQVLRRVLDGEFAAPDKERPAVGARWAAVIARAIARSMTDRYQDVRELAAEMRANLTEVGIEEPLAEVYRFLKDPAEYEAALGPKLVSVLVARAERARAEGNIQAAAGDLNRAVAYAPDDVELLRRLTNLARGQRRRQLARRAAMIPVPFAVLGVGTWAVVAAVRSSHVTPSASATVARSAAASAPASIPPAVSTVAPAVSTALIEAHDELDAAAAHSGARLMPLPKLPPNTIAPPVRIMANYTRALFSIDGGEAQPVGFGQTVHLVVGPHVVAFSVPKGYVCCDGTSVNIDVKATEEGARPQQVFGRLSFRDAKVSLAGGPEGAKMTCPSIASEVRAGAQISVKMSDAIDRMSCFLYGPEVAGQEMPVVLKAGELSVVGWPRP